MYNATTAREELDRIALQPGETIYTILRSVARSGMSRRLDLMVFRDNAPVRLTHLVAPIIGASYTPHRGMMVRGTGMDMGFEAVYSLSTCLFGDGYMLQQRWL